MEVPGSAAAQLVEQFAERVARRDVPPPPDPNRFEAPQVLDRLAWRLQPLSRYSRLRSTLARICYAFVAEPERSAAALSAAAGVGREAISNAVGILQRGGLLQYQYRNRRRQYRLTRFGEDWLLAIAQDTEPPALPAAS